MGGDKWLVASLVGVLPQERRYASVPRFFSVHGESQASLLMVFLFLFGLHLSNRYREGGEGGWGGVWGGVGGVVGGRRG